MPNVIVWIGIAVFAPLVAVASEPGGPVVQEPSVPHRLALATVHLEMGTAADRRTACGTIVRQSGNEVRILTCAHAFDSAAAQTPVRIWVMRDARLQCYSGTLVAADFGRDVALVVTTCSDKLTTVPVSFGRDLPLLNAAVYIGSWPHGDRPTISEARVSGHDRFPGCYSLTVTFRPSLGGSVGGLVDRHGKLVAICNAVDLNGRQGNFSHLLQLPKGRWARGMQAPTTDGPSPELARLPLGD